MGGGTFDPHAYASTARSYASKPTAAVFKSSGMQPHLDPKGIVVRESRDSPDNPNSSPLIVGVDVTGSMHVLADKMAREGLGTLFTEVLDRKPISDPHVMFMAIGDADWDRAPLQVSQFEADNRVLDQLTDLWLEGNGGGNGWESYNLPWYFAANHTSIDSFEKRQKKGYLFTVGDEPMPPDLTPAQIKKVFGDEASGNLSNDALLQSVQKMYHVFHIVVEEGSHALIDLPGVLKSWRPLGQHVLRLSDYTKMSEVIVSTMQIIEGADPVVVTKSWKGDTSLVVANAVGGLTSPRKGKAGAGVTRF